MNLKCSFSVDFDLSNCDEHAIDAGLRGILMTTEGLSFRHYALWAIIRNRQ